MKKVYMIHGWGGSSSDNWFPWLRQELKDRNVDVRVFDMPYTENPRIESWVKHLEKNVKDVDEDTCFIGHSIGCQTIMRFLEKLHKDKKIGGCIFVAPFFDLINLQPEEMKIAHPWLTTHIDFSRILEHCNHFLCLFSKDDPDVHLQEAEKFKQNLDAKIIILDGKGHFDGEIQPELLMQTLSFLRTG